MTTTKNTREITNALRYAYACNNHSITIGTQESEPIEFIGDGFSGTLPKGRIVLNATNHTALTNQKEEDIKLQIVACPEDVEFELSMRDKEFVIPALKDAKILSQDKTFKPGDIVSAELSSDDHYGITTHRNGYIGKVMRMEHRDGFNLATYSRLGLDSNMDNSNGDFENFSVSHHYFRLASATEVLHGSNSKIFTEAKYIGRRDGLAILPLKGTIVSEHGDVLGVLEDGSKVSLSENVAFFDRHLQTFDSTLKRGAYSHPLKGEGHEQARRLRII